MTRRVIPFPVAGGHLRRLGIPSVARDGAGRLPSRKSPVNSPAGPLAGVFQNTRPPYFPETDLHDGARTREALEIRQGQQSAPAASEIAAPIHEPAAAPNRAGSSPSLSHSGAVPDVAVAGRATTPTDRDPRPAADGNLATGVAVGRTPILAAWALSQRRAAGIPLDAWEFD